MTPEQKRALYDLKASVDRILFILESDNTTNQMGLVEKVNTMNKTLNQLLMREEIFKAKASVWGVIGGAIVSIVIIFVKFLIAKFLG